MTIDLLKELKRLLVGVCIIVPVFVVYAITLLLVSKGYVTSETISYTLGSIAILFFCWSAGGAYESFQEMKRMQTDNAFRKLGHRD